MEIIRAKEVVGMLADGVDPTTGKVFPPGSHFNDPDVIRALHTVLRSVRTPSRITGIKKSLEDRQRHNVEDGWPKNMGLPWTDDHRKELAALFSKGKKLPGLSLQFGRTLSAIRLELIRQGLMEASPQTNESSKKLVAANK